MEESTIGPQSKALAMAAANVLKVIAIEIENGKFHGEYDIAISALSVTVNIRSECGELPPPATE